MEDQRMDQAVESRTAVMWEGLPEPVQLFRAERDPLVPAQSGAAGLVTCGE